ncbi:hypothetical protein J4573_04915 [Actinomadura barringtoniae]|uniref:Uncharacterized protein n=1 Tax=Actinomadura barringtoniae TaxID=1427535 RepID=A0A939PBV7_9ACTN|nr:hypothetical protein [Actinomadura barringtoniae]MBO2446419.1 hypothetical protein [Actinomadura barringtoniae]
MPNKRSALRFIQIGLMYLGANAWPCAEVYHALRAATAEGKEPTLSDYEHSVLMALEQQFTDPTVPAPRHPTD